MEMNKVVNLDSEELAQHLRQSAEQVFRLHFQMRMGQNEGLKKLRELKKDIARMKTVERQRELGIATPAHETEAKTQKTPRKTKKASKTKASSGAKSKKTAKKAAGKASKKTSKAASKTKSASRNKVRAAKRGRANAKKGGS